MVSDDERRGPEWGAAPDTLQTDAGLVRLRAYRPGDEQQIVNVYRAGFDLFYPSEKPVDEAEYVAWFAEPHGSHTSAVAVAEIDSRIISVTTSLHRAVLVGGRRLRGTAGGLGRATDPDFAGRGVQRALNDWRLSNLVPPGETRAEQSRRPPRHGAVVRRPGMAVYFKVLHPWRAATGGFGSRLARGLGFGALVVWSRARTALRSEPAGVVLGTLSAFDARFERLIEEASAGWDYIPTRSVEYLNWRFCDERAGRFIVRAAEENGELLGYSVSHRIGLRGHIVDLLALPGRADVVRALVDDATLLMEADGAAAVECWMLRRHPYARALRQAGFVRHVRASREVDRQISIFGRGMSPEERARIVAPDARIHLIRADFDAI